MTPRQIVIRDLFGRVVYNQIFPNLHIGLGAISLFIHMWGGPLGNILFIRPKNSKEFIKTTFKIYETAKGLVLRNKKGEVVPLPEIDPDEIEALQEDEEYEEDEDEDWDDDDDDDDDWEPDENDLDELLGR